MLTEEKNLQLKQMAQRMRLNALKMALDAGSNGAHLGGSLSCIEIFATLYGALLHYDVSNPIWENRDRLILSKGHAALTWYAALIEAGFIPKEQMSTYKSNDTPLSAHPCINAQLGIEFSSGSLGQGLSLGVGVALALKRKDNHLSRVFVIVGDGECNEGSIWEAAAAASHYKLNNLTLIVDKNGLQYDGATQNVLNMDNLADKFRSFGFSAQAVDGHNCSTLYSALVQQTEEKPLAVIAQTVKGKGVSFMENVPSWHHCRLSKEQYESAVKEVEAQA